MLKSIIFLVGLSCLCSFVSAAPLTFTLSSAQELALSRNYELSILRYEIEKARTSSSGSGTLPNPELGISGTSGFLSSNKSSYAWSVSLSQKFPITGRLRLLQSLVAEEIALAQAEFTKAELALKYDIATHFDSLEANAAEASMLKAQLALNEEWLALLHKKVERAEASSLDVSNTQIVNARLEQKLLALERKRVWLIDQLKQLCAITEPQEIEIDHSTIDRPRELPEFTIDLWAAHPAITLKERLATLASNQKKLALSNRWEDVTVALFYEEDYGMDEPMGYDKDRMLGLSFSIPLPIRNRNVNEIETARVRERQISAELIAIKQEHQQKAESIRRSYAAISCQIEAYRATIIRSSEERLKSLEMAYSSGLVEVAEVFRERERLLEIQTEYLQLKAEQASLLTEWRYTTAQF